MMFRSKNLFVTIVAIALIALIFTSSASAKEVLFNGSIEEGDGYQINNIVIDVAEVFVDAGTCVFKVYDQDELIHDKMLNEEDSFSFDVEEGTIEFTLDAVIGGMVPRATMSITIDDDDAVYLDKIVDGGQDKAEFSGTPELKITKEVSSYSVEQGDVVTIKVVVRNDGDGRATEVRFTDPKPAGFILQEITLEEAGPMSIDKYEERTIFLYKLQANEPGTFELKPTVATFSNEADLDFPQATSNRPVVTVTGEEKVAELEFSTSMNTRSVQRGDDVEVTINIRNIGEASANGVLLNIQIPEGLDFEGSSDNIEMINNVPKVYIENFGLNQEKEIKYNIKPTEVGTYTITTEYSYQYDSGSSKGPEVVSGELTTNALTVVKGEYDVLFEQPLYVYAIPLVFILAIGGWVFYRSRQYKY
ncbi:hypothetical protein LI82_12185 [Methanococcoides methylutens]|uniref:DUF11 domain-containing protein n=2 Tax=Methanococcoides methylutens TaxID=2226 RepID=A0A099SZW4_METMT|nr:hypothetical protein LI82_12185 [Methanococcoides methylutens]